MDTTELEAAYRELTKAGEADKVGDTIGPGEPWSADFVLAHVVASSRMLAAASAELLAGRIPVIDNRPTQSWHYLSAIVESAAGRRELLHMVRRSGHELVILVGQLSPEQTATGPFAGPTDPDPGRVVR